MKSYYRVEVYDYDEERSISGFVSILRLITCIELGLDIKVDDEVIAEAISKSENLRVKELSNLLAIFVDNLKKPEVYMNDKSNYMCLFKEQDFANKECFFELLNDYIRASFPSYDLIWYEFELPDEALVYEDENQIVISKEDYEKYKPLVFYAFEDDDDYDEEDEDFESDE